VYSGLLVVLTAPRRVTAAKATKYSMQLGKCRLTTSPARTPAAASAAAAASTRPPSDACVNERPLAASISAGCEPRDAECSRM